MLLSSLFLAAVSAQSCTLDAGNYYCSNVKLVEYDNIGFSGSYNRVTSFNSDGSCSSTPQSFSGPLSPFDEELSVHFRGPIQLENFAVYTKSNGQQQQPQRKRALHHRHAEPEPVYVTATAAVTDYVTVDQWGNLETATKAAETSSEPSTSAAATTSSSAHGFLNIHNYNHEDQSSATGPSVITLSTSSANSSPTTSATTSTSSSAPSSSSTASSGSGSWSQIASYNAQGQSANGLVFLNNMGGSGSGVFDYVNGNSLSYAGSDGVSGAASPQILKQTVVPSDDEFIIFTDNECQGSDCGYSRPGTVAYHGFEGTYKVFLFEFSMPTESQKSPGTYNYDMPAVWLLNAQIPRTLQYGNSECSCWSSGCGELDLFEVLNSGNDKLTNHLHDKQGNNGGGTGDYFNRPTQGTLKAAAIFNGDTFTIVELDSFPSSVDDATIQQWINSAQGQSTKVSI